MSRSDRESVWLTFLYSFVIGIVFLTLTGCAQMFTAKTKASYIKPDGTTIMYESDKEQIGLEARVDPKTGAIEIKVDKAGTQEAVIAAVLQVQVKMLDMIQQLQALMNKAPGPVPTIP